MKLFPAAEPLAFFAIDIRGELIFTKREKIVWLMITDLFIKLTRKIPLTLITTTDLAHKILQHLMFVYGPSKTVLSENSIQFMSRFFNEVCRIIGSRDFYTKTYHPKLSGQVDRFNRTILQVLSNYIFDNNIGIFSRTH